MPNYFVVIPGHISWFVQYEAALAMAREFSGFPYSIWGLTQFSED